MRAFVIAVALASLVIPAVMADPEPVQTSAGIQTPTDIQRSILVPTAPLEAFRPPKDKNFIPLDASMDRASNDSNGR